MNAAVATMIAVAAAGPSDHTRNPGVNARTACAAPAVLNGRLGYERAEAEGKVEARG